jgi:DNA repair photolyase
MYVIHKFDPWNNQFCTCPEKFSLNPYTGCDHRCIYCYSTYIPHFYTCRRKKDLHKKMKSDLQKIPKNSIISISNSSDPYPSIEKKYGDTRRALEILGDHEMKVLIVTKGDRVVRDIDLLTEMNAVVAVTVTTLHAKRLEPNAPSPRKRLDALRTLNDHGIPTVLRLDPLFLYLSTDYAAVIKEGVEAGVRHIVSSTYKAKWDNWKRFSHAYPEIARKTYPLYFEEGMRVGRSYYLPEKIRKEMLQKVKDLCEGYGISFSTCRENLEMISSSCDGSHLF